MRGLLFLLFFFLFLTISLAFLTWSNQRQKLHSSIREVGATTRRISVEDSNNLVDFFQIWIREESLESLLPKTSMFKVIDELKNNTILWERSKSRYNELMLEYEAKLRNEKRTLQAILGEAATKEILKSSENLDIYDPQTVKAFMGSQAIELMIGGILYEAIFEFTKSKKPYHFE